MTRHVLDASAVLAWLQEEPGYQLVDEALADGAISAVNWSEVLQKAAEKGRDPNEVALLLRSVGLATEPAGETDALAAATLWRSATHLSLADRFCLALASRLACPAVTADRSWTRAAIDIDIQYLR